MTVNTTVQIAKDSGFTQLVYNKQVPTENQVAINCESAGIPYGVPLHARIKQTNDDPSYTGTPESKWSKTVNFTASQPNQIIGVCMDLNNHAFYWIDADGNQVSYFDYHEHPVYKNTSMVTFDASRVACQFTKIPLFYIKTATSGPSGTFSNGKKCWWMSDLPMPGYRPHPAFKRSASRANGKYVINTETYIGTYFGNLESVAGSGNCIGSRKGTSWSTGYTVDQYRTYCNNRNHSGYGQSGYRIFDVHDMSLMRWLALLAVADPQTTKKWGYSTSSSSYAGSTTNRLVFQGTQSNPITWIDDAWMRRYWYVDKLTITNGYVHIMNPFNTSEASGPGDNANSRTTTQGFMNDVCSGNITIGDDTHDLMEYFLPKTVTGSQNLSTFKSWYETDKRFSGSIRYIWFGSCYDRWDMDGVATADTLGCFHMNIDNDASYGTVGCRICKS